VIKMIYALLVSLELSTIFDLRDESWDFFLVKSIIRILFL
jgi:hypothetical protein